MGVAYTTRFSTIHWTCGYKGFECATKCMGVISQNALSLTAPPSGGNSTIDYKIFRQVWVILQVWWVLEYVQAVKNVIISSKDKKKEKRKRIIWNTTGSLQVPCSGPKYSRKQQSAGSNPFRPKPATLTLIPRSRWHRPLCSSKLCATHSHDKP